MKIIFLCDSLIKGGRERRMIELIKGLTKDQKIQVELILFKNLIEYPEVYDLGISIHIINRKPKHNPVTFLKVYQICKKSKPDILHTWSSMSAIFAFPAIKLLKIKLLNGNIASAPNGLNIWDRDYFRAKLTFGYSDLIIGNSRAGLHAFRAPKSKSICIPNGFDFRRLERLENQQSVRNKYNIGTEQIVGKIAAFASRKDYVTYIEAAQKVLKVKDNVIFFAVGNGPDFEKTQRTVPKLLENKIIFTGSISNVESIINIFDIGVLCTNLDVHGEGISNSILEYMAIGKPVVATEGGGTNEIIVDGETGFLVPQKSSNLLADKILELLNNQKKSKAMGIAGKNRILNHFELEKMTAKYYEVYCELNEVKS